MSMVVEGGTFSKVVVRIKQNNTLRGLGMVPGSQGTTKFTYGYSYWISGQQSEVDRRVRLRRWTS